MLPLTRAAAMCPANEDASEAAAFPGGDWGGSPADTAGMGESSGGVGSGAAAPVACFLLLRGALGEGGAGTVVVELPDASGGDDCSGGGVGCTGGGVPIVSSPVISARERRSPARFGRASCIMDVMVCVDAFPGGGALVLFCAARAGLATSFERASRTIISDTFCRRRETKAGLPPPVLTGAASRGLARRVAALEGWSTDPCHRRRIQRRSAAGVLRSGRHHAHG